MPSRLQVQRRLIDQAHAFSFNSKAYRVIDLKAQVMRGAAFDELHAGSSVVG